MSGKIIEREIFAQALAFLITFLVFVYASTTIYGFTVAFILGILAVIVTHFAIQGETYSISVKMRVLGKISTYDLLALIYGVLLTLLLSANVLRLLPNDLIFLSEWGTIPLREYIMLPPSILGAFFFPGYVILRVIDRNDSIPTPDAFVFSFLLSYLFTPLTGLVSILLFGEIYANFYLLASLLLLVFCFLLRAMMRKVCCVRRRNPCYVRNTYIKQHLGRRKGARVVSFCGVRNNLSSAKRDTGFHVDLVMLIVFCMFLVAVLAFSKEWGYFPGFDIWRHQGSAISIIKYGIASVQLPLRWFHLGLACFFVLSNFPLVNSALIFNLFNIMPILAFYCLAREIFKERGRFMTSISTLFFSTFAGFGWIYAFERMLGEGWSTAICNTASITGNDTLFSNLWIWGHSPAVVGFTAFFMLLYLLFHATRNTIAFTLTLSIFISSWLMHPSEVLIYVIIFGVAFLIFPFVDKSRKIAISAALLSGLSAVLIITLIFPKVGLFEIGLLESLLVLAYLSMVVGIVLGGGKIIGPLKKHIQIRLPNSLPRVLVVLICSLWLLSFFFWFQQKPILFEIQAISGDIGLVPWYTYPMRLGLIGFLAILGALSSDRIRVHLKEMWPYFVAFGVLALVLFIFGKFVTVTKLYFFALNYWEIRILRFYIHAVISLLAAMSIVYLISLIRNQASRWKPAFFRSSLAILVSTIIIFGTTSTVLSVNFWGGQPRYSVERDLGLANAMLNSSTPFWDQSAIFASITAFSNDILDRLGVYRAMDPIRSVIASASNDETYYFATWFAQTKYLLYIPEFDAHFVKSNRDSCVYTDIFDHLNPMYNVSGRSVYIFPYRVPPTPNSEVLVLLPTSLPYDYVLEALARMNRTYDVTLSNALTTIHRPVVVLPYDPLDVKLNDELMESVDDGMKLILFNVNGLGNIAERLGIMESTSKPKLTIADSIGDEQRLVALPFEANVPVLYGGNASTFYMYNGSFVSPFIIRRSYGSGYIVYINAMPLTENALSYSVIPEIMTFILENCELPTFNLTREYIDQHLDVYAHKVVADGSVVTNSSSLIFIKGSQPDIDIPSYSGRTFSIKAKEVSFLSSEKGTYSKVIIPGPFELLVLENGKLIKTYRVEKNSTLLVKDPHVAVSGETVLENAYWRKNSGHWGRTLTFLGDSEFTLHYPNKLLFIFDFKYQGSFRSLIPYPDFVRSYPSLEWLNETLYLSFIIVVVIVVLDMLKVSKRSFTISRKIASVRRD